jgi:hypothetical protein
MTTPRLDAGFIVRGGNGKPIGAVIAGRGLSSNKFAAWSGTGKAGEFDSAEEAIAAVRKAHLARKQKERRR